MLKPAMLTRQLLLLPRCRPPVRHCERSVVGWSTTHRRREDPTEANPTRRRSVRAARPLPNGLTAHAPRLHSPCRHSLNVRAASRLARSPAAAVRSRALPQLTKVMNVAGFGRTRRANRSYTCLPPRRRVVVTPPSSPLSIARDPAPARQRLHSWHAAPCLLNLARRAPAVSCRAGRGGGCSSPTTATRRGRERWPACATGAPVGPTASPSSTSRTAAPS